ncbi:MAG: YvcK family protein [Chloroflexi bacterium]|nr:YvcK family protein [Chloroflexota bacterium]
MRTNGMNVVSIGGGLGAVQVMQGLKSHTDQLTGIIAVTDTGRSTGIVREFAQIPAPGDIRNALATLSADDGSLLSRVMQHRIVAPGDPKLDGMAFGNLFIAALTQMSDSFVKAIQQISDFLDVQADIFPVSEENTHICAELMDGTIVEEEFNVRQLDKAAIKRIFVQNPEATVYPPCIDALQTADLITIGPGSLFTTVIACLAFKEIAQAIRDSSALKVYVCNTTTQPGQTDDYSLSDHVQQVVSYLGLGILDYVVLNSTQPSPELMDLYAREQVNVLLPTPDEIHKIKTMNVTPVLADVADTGSGKRALWQKQDTIRHNPELIAAILLNLMSERMAVKSAG